MMVKYTAWRWNDDLGDWVAVKSKLPWQKKARTSVSEKRAGKIVYRLRKRNIPATARQSSKGKPKRPPKGKTIKSKEDLQWQHVHKWLYGDLDAKLELLFPLSRVALGLHEKLYVAEGKRSIADQWKYWYAYKAGRGPLAAFPGTSKHTHGDAADVRQGAQRGTRNLGDIPGARELMKKHGLCLPVPGETWHTELGNNWRA